MQYIDRDGNRHNIPLYSVQPKISSDEDNQLYESPNGLKVDKVTTELVLNTVLDALYPIGSYAFGVKPTIGIWEEVVGDRALWLKNTVDDGTTIEQALPNIKARAGLNYIVSDGYVAFQNYEGAFYRSDEGTGGSGRRWPGVGSTGDARNYPHFRFNASRSSNIYKDGANVQPNAYVMKVYKRIA